MRDGLPRMGFLFSGQRKIALLPALEISMKKHSCFVTVRVRIGVSLLLLGFFAVTACRAQTVAVHLQQGTAALMHGNCSAAETELHAALKAAPTLASAQGLLGICEKRMGEPGAQAHLEAGFAKVTDPKLRTEIGVELADYDYQRGDLDHTLPVVRTLVAMNPENIDILFFAQNVYQDMADDTLNKLALLAPDSPRMQEVVAEHLVNRRRSERRRGPLSRGPAEGPVPSRRAF